MADKKSKVLERLKEISDLKKKLPRMLKHHGYEPDQIVRKTLNLIKERDKNGDQEVGDALLDMMEKTSKVLSLDTKYYMICSVDPHERPFALEMARSLEKEYEVKTPTEKALVQTAVVAYCQMQKCSRLLLNRMTPEWLSNEKAQFLAITGREVDKAHRRFLRTIETLKQMKTPPMKVSVKAENAYMAQNQQFNNQIDNEINKV